MSHLVADNLACIKQDRLLFEGLSFNLSEGELLHLQGNNGAGKTSLLRILVGLAQAENGDVFWNNQSISQYRQHYHRELIYISHKPGISLSLSAVENIHFWCEQQGVGAPGDVYGLLATLGLVGLEDIPTGQLSAGQQRRVALSRLWLKPARLWVLDEPLTALDRHGVTMLYEKMQQHLQQQGMIIITSHQTLELQAKVRPLVLEYRL